VLALRRRCFGKSRSSSAAKARWWRTAHFRVLIRSALELQGERRKEGHVAEHKLQGKKIAFLATDMVEEVELTQPWEAVEEAGGTPELLSIKGGEIQAFNHYDKSKTYKVDEQVSSARMDDYDGLVIPGGVGNPDTLRMDDDAVEFVRSFFEAGKPMAVICHGPWLLVEADVVRGRKLTSFPSLQNDIRNAGGEWVDEEVVVDNGLVTSRKPDDLPAFCAKLVEELAEGVHTKRAEKVAAG
jgi:protease I